MKGRHYIEQILLRWQVFKIIEVLIIALGIWLGISILSGNNTLSSGVALIVFLVGLIITAPWKLTLKSTANLIDHKLPGAEHSSALVLVDAKELSSIARLQQSKIERILTSGKKIIPPHRFLRAFLIAAILVVTGMAFKLMDGNTTIKVPKNEIKITHSNVPDSVENPTITAAQLSVQLPAYAGGGKSKQTGLSVSVLEGSTLSWEISTSSETDSMKVTFLSGTRILKTQDHTNFSFSLVPVVEEIYYFSIIDDGFESSTESYSINLISDSPPDILVSEMENYLEFSNDDQDKKISIIAEFSDDYGLTNVNLIATIATGAGESVKFREQKIAMPSFIAGRKSFVPKFSLDLDSMEMQPGDEIYYYLEAVDNKAPVPQTSRSETFFAMIPDTTELLSMTGGSMGVNLMPDYFRSQRQLIIDTEALISEKSDIPDKEFRQRSNELGYDQKLLRLRYGQFMGDEFESGITEEASTLEEAIAEGETEKTVEDFSHDHDSEEHQAPLESEDPELHEEGLLAKYLHDHDDPEEATLYAAGLRAMLKQAMAEMWDSELHLRLMDPKTSLPHQYKTLNLLEKIKNHARVYVHRIGFDPPPVKEENRLSGDLEDIDNRSRSSEPDVNDEYGNIRILMKWLSDIEIDGFIESDTVSDGILHAAGNEVAKLVLKNPEKNLALLEHIKFLERTEVINWQVEGPTLRNELYKILPPAEKKPFSKTLKSRSALDSIYLQLLERSGRE